jgi:hypothetical protein
MKEAYQGGWWRIFQYLFRGIDRESLSREGKVSNGMDEGSWKENFIWLGMAMKESYKDGWWCHFENKQIVRLELYPGRKETFAHYFSRFWSYGGTYRGGKIQINGVFNAAGKEEMVTIQMPVEEYAKFRPQLKSLAGR